MALSMFEEALRENPDDILAHAHASFIRFHLEDYSKAWDHLSRALKIDPNNSQARFYLAIFFWECGMYREALIEWEKVMEFEPGSHLSKKAQENIIILQKALNAPTSSSDWKPRR
jgi:tetratricopeptide (TPR) repeat protein